MRGGRSQRLRQVQHHRCRALGARGGLREASARRVHGRRHLQRLDRAQAGGAGGDRTGFRQHRRHARRRVRELCRDRDPPYRQPRRVVALLPQRHAVPAARYHRHLSRHRPRPAQLRDHRAGHDLAPDRSQARGSARLHRGGRGHLQVQGAAQGYREPHPPHAREPRAPDGLSRGTRAPVAAPQAPGRGRRALLGAEDRGAAHQRRAAGAAVAPARCPGRGTARGCVAPRGRTRGGQRAPHARRRRHREGSRAAFRAERGARRCSGALLRHRRRYRAHRAVGAAAAGTRAAVARGSRADAALARGGRASPAR